MGYAWYRDGQLVSSAASYTANVGDYQFGLRVQVTDQTTASRWADYWVDVNGVRAEISGPSAVYFQQGGGTWTVSGRGGYPPYSFDWYTDDGYGQRYWVGSGSSWSGYPGDGDRYLVVEMRDSRGALYSASKWVQGLNPPGCGPISCDP
jgi:hypothetical protein